MDDKRIAQYKFDKALLTAPSPPPVYSLLTKRGQEWLCEMPGGGHKTVIRAHQVDSFVRDYYGDIGNPGALRGSLAIYKAISAEYVGVSRRDVERVLANMETSQLFKAAPMVPVIRPQVAKSPNQQWSADTGYVEHEGERLFTILVVIDIMSKYMWAQMVKIPATHQRFSGRTVAAAMESILAGEPGGPAALKTDNGVEFKSRDFEAMLRARQIKHLYSLPGNPRSNSFAEGAVKQIKILIGKYLNSVNGIYLSSDKLQQLVQSYNQTYHSTIKAAPEAVHFGNRGAIQAAHKNIKRRAVRVVAKTQGVYPELAVGDTVRVHNRVSAEWLRYTKLKKRVYESQWSEDLFKIRMITRAKPGVSSHYYLWAPDGKPIAAAFVRPDLQKIDPQKLVPNLAVGHWVVDRVVDKKTVGGEVRYLIQWDGYPKSQATWERPQKGYLAAIEDYQKGKK